MIKAIVFDLDDTLISEREYIDSGFRHLSKLLCGKLGRQATEVFDTLQNLFSDDPKNVFNRLFESAGVSYTDDIIKNCVEEYREHLPLIHYYEDVLPCVNHLKAQGIKTGVITDGYSIAQRQKIRAVRANEYFDEIIVTDELGREFWKPHARSFEIMRERLEVDFSEMVYVGDNPEKDFYIGSVLPIMTIRIHREGVYKSRNYLNNIKEHKTIYSLDEISLL